MKSGIELINDERNEQLDKHSYSKDHDIKVNNHYQLSQAASILIGEVDMDDYEATPEEMCPPDWNEEIFKKMCGKTYEERLIIAGALIAAELDRLQSMKPDFLV